MRTTAALQLLPTQAAVAPGGRLEISLIVTNTGELVDRYDIRITGVPTEWCEQDQQSVSLFPGEQKTVRITVQPPVGHTTTSGVRPVTITASSEVDELAETSAEFTLTIEPTGSLQFELSPKRVVGRRAQFRARLENQANAPMTFSLMTQDAEAGLNIQPDIEGSMTLAPGEQRTVGLAVRPKRRETIGEPHPYDLEVWVLRQGKTPDSAPDPALLRRANFTFTPRLSALSVPLWLRRMPRWLLLLLLLLLLGLVALGGARTAASRPAPPPIVVPTRVVVSPTVVPTVPLPTIALPDPAVVKSFGITALPDGSVTVNWATSGAEQVVLDDTLVDSNGRQTLHLTSARTLILSVTNARGTVSQTLVLQPAQTQATGNAIAGAQYLPVVSRFTRDLDPKTGNPVLKWIVNSALKVQIDGKRVAASGKRIEKTGPATYKLIASNKFGSVLITLSVHATTAGTAGKTIRASLPPPLIKSFTIVPASGNLGNRLQWETRGAHRVLINGKPVGQSGGLAIGPPHTGQTFTLLADNGYLTSEVTIRVTVTHGSGATAAFTIALPVIKTFAITSSHGSRYMTWRVVGADHSSISGTGIPLTGKAPLPPGYKTLTLEATNDAGTTKVTITVAGSTPTRTRTRTATPTRTRTRTATPTLTATSTPTATSIPRHTFTKTATPHRTIHRLGRTATPTHIRPRTRTATPRPIGRPPTHSATPTASATDTRTASRTATPTDTWTPTRTPTATPTRRLLVTVPRPTIRPTHTDTDTDTPTARPTHTDTGTPTPRPTHTDTGTPTLRPTHVPTHTPTNTPTHAPTRTKTPTPTRVFTHTPIPTHTATATGTPTPISPTINVAPNPLVITGSGTANLAAASPLVGTLTVTNLGPGPLAGPVSVTLAAGGNPQFSLVGGTNPCSSVTTMAVDGTCTDIVVFKGCYNGTAPTAAINILAPHAANGTETVPVSFAPALGQCAAGISVSPSSVNFVACPTSSSGTAICNAAPNPIVLTVTNTGNGTLVVGALTATVNGNGGTLNASSSPSCASVAPGDQCAITVSFSPSQSGLYQAVGGTLVINSNAVQGPQTLPVSWPGAPPPVTPQPTVCVPSSFNNFCGTGG